MYTAVLELVVSCWLLVISGWCEKNSNLLYLVKMMNHYHPSLSKDFWGDKLYVSLL
jgi:hypothetical protein